MQFFPGKKWCQHSQLKPNQSVTTLHHYTKKHSIRSNINSVYLVRWNHRHIQKWEVTGETQTKASQTCDAHMKHHFTPSSGCSGDPGAGRWPLLRAFDSTHLHKLLWTKSFLNNYNIIQSKYPSPTCRIATKPHEEFISVFWRKLWMLTTDFNISYERTHVDSYRSATSWLCWISSALRLSIFHKTNSTTVATNQTDFCFSEILHIQPGISAYSPHVNVFK